MRKVFFRASRRIRLVRPALQLRDQNMGCYLSESELTVQMEEAVALHCGCGHGILCEVMRAGEHLGFLAFFDDEPRSETCGERVEHCPDCSEQLGLPMLFAKNRPA